MDCNARLASRELQTSCDRTQQPGEGLLKYCNRSGGIIPMKKVAALKVSQSRAMVRSLRTCCILSPSLDILTSSPTRSVSGLPGDNFALRSASSFSVAVDAFQCCACKQHRTDSYATGCSERVDTYKLWPSTYSFEGNTQLFRCAC